MLKATIAGCGFIAPKKHIPAFLKLKDKVELVAVCDLNENAAKQIAERFNIRKFYTNFNDMLAIEKPDIVDICTPPQTHTKLAIQALDSGANILLEKPMATVLPDCNLMIEAASKNNKKIGIVHNQAFNPAFLKGKEMFSNGAIGNFLGMQIFLSTPTDYMTSSKDHWAHKLPGGVLGETGPHSIYLALAYLKNIYDANIFSKKLLFEYSWSASEDFRFELIAENGICSVTQIYGSNQWAAEIDIYGTKGILKIDLQTKSLYLYNRPSLNPVSLGIGSLKKIISFSFDLSKNSFSYMFNFARDAHSIAIRDFIDSIIENKPFPASGEDGRETVRVMEMLIKKLDENLKKPVVSK